MSEFNSSEDLYNKYNTGFNGCLWEPESFEELISLSKYPYFAEGARILAGSGRGKLSTPYKSVLYFDKTSFTERQSTGDCVSHSTRNACDVTRAVEIHIKHERESWVARGATEAIYGVRGHSGQGMSCSRAAQFVSKTGGVLVRKKYDDVDLSKYNGSIGARWGRGGIPRGLQEEAAKHQIQTVSLIETVEEARDALANGYALSVCSGYGFSNRRDSRGFARKSGSWSHAMAWTACDDTGKEPAFLVQNSWGKWNDGGHPEWGPIPDGSFLIDADTAQGMLNQNGAYAFSGFDGFPPQKLPSYGFETYL